jgi:outer membrane receptor for ferrienterochelin and colicin
MKLLFSYIIKGLWFLLSFLYPVITFSQDIRGVLTDTVSGEGVKYASVSLFDIVRDKKPVMGTISDSSGFFRLTKVHKGDYVLRINCIGYHTKELAISVAERGNIDLQTINMKINELVLDEAVITGENRLITLKPDKKIITVDNAMSSSGESVAEILKIIPEIRVDNETITLKNQSFSIYMNGKPASISRQQLFQIPASTVAKIEVMTNPSVKYSPDGLGGIVNIITKKRLSGINGIAQVAGRTDNNYGAALTANYGLEKFNLFMTFFPWYYKTETEGYSTTVIENVGTIEEKLLKQNNYFNENFKLGFDWDITKNDLTTVYWSQMYIDGKYRNNIASKSTKSVPPSTVGTNNAIDADFKTRQNVLSLNYIHRFKKEDTELSFDFLQTFSESPQHREYRITDDNGILTTAPYRLFPKDNVRSSEFTGSFVTVLSKKINLNMDAGFDLELNRENDKNEGATFVNNVWKDSLNAINLFLFEEYIPSVYAVFDFNVKKIDFTIGARAEYYHAKWGMDVLNKNRSEFNLYPSFGVAYSMNDNNEFNFNYNRRIERPEAYDLSPIVYVSDYVTERYTGNENLRPAFSNSFEFGYSFNKNSFGVNTSVSYMDTKDEIDRMFFNVGEIRYKTSGNLVDKQTFMFDYGFNWKYKILSIYLMGSVYNENYRKKTTETTEEDNYWNHDIRFIPQLKFRNNYNLNLQMIYYGNQYYAYSKRTESLRVSLYASKTFKNLTVSFNAINFVNNIFRKYMWGTSFSNETFFDNHDTALFHFGILYKFGKETKARAQTNLNNNPIQLNR